jgi:histidine ammonia-lyase
MAVSELASISERRVEHLLNPALSDGLPPFLVKESGLNSGFMIAQVAAASLVSENKVLAHPASVDSIPSSANREDHVSMGFTSATKALSIVENVRYALAVEVLAAAQGLDFRRPLKPGVGALAAYEFVRSSVPFENEDRVLAWDINKVAAMLDPDGGFVQSVTDRVGHLL